MASEDDKWILDMNSTSSMLSTNSLGVDCLILECSNHQSCYIAHAVVRIEILKEKK